MFVELICVHSILRRWREDPQAPKKAYRSISRWQDGSAANNKPFSAAEVAKYKAFLKRNAPASYYNLFPEERH
jgi:hypothetical protein